MVCCVLMMDDNTHATQAKEVAFLVKSVPSVAKNSGRGENEDGEGQQLQDTQTNECRCL